MNKNLHPCLAFRNLHIESRDLINMFLKFNIDLFESKDCFDSGKMQIPFSMPIGNVELMHECSSEHFRTGTVRLQAD